MFGAAPGYVFCRMDFEELDRFCRSLPGAVREYPFGPQAAVWRLGAGGKMFALCIADRTPLRVNLKCEPQLAHDLRQSYPKDVLPGYHMNKRHWNTVIVGGAISDDMLQEMIEDSYDLVRGIRPQERPT